MKNKRLPIFITFVFGISVILPVYGPFDSSDEGRPKPDDAALLMAGFPLSV